MGARADRGCRVTTPRFFVASLHGGPFGVYRTTVHALPRGEQRWAPRGAVWTGDSYRQAQDAARRIENYAQRAVRCGGAA